MKVNHTNKRVQPINKQMDQIKFLYGSTIARHLSIALVHLKDYFLEYKLPLVKPKWESDPVQMAIVTTMKLRKLTWDLWVATQLLNA